MSDIKVELNPGAFRLRYVVVFDDSPPKPSRSPAWVQRWRERRKRRVVAWVDLERPVNNGDTFTLTSPVSLTVD